MSGRKIPKDKGPKFSTTRFPDGSEIHSGSLPDSILPWDADSPEFEELWNLHPTVYSEAMIHGRTVKMPRWIQAYEKDYPYSNQTAVAESAPPEIKKFLKWSAENIDPTHNGILINWHDGKEKHYHGKHRDSEKGLIEGTSIITISLGEERVFRMRPYPDSNPKYDLILGHGDFIVIPWETNRKWTHEVPKFARYKGRRISITLRGFE